MSSPNGQPGNRTVDAKYFTSKPPSIRCIDTYVDLRGGYETVLFVVLIHMLISGAVMKLFYLGRGGGEGGGPLLFTQGYARKKKEEEPGGTKK